MLLSCPCNPYDQFYHFSSPVCSLREYHNCNAGALNRFFSCLNAMGKCNSIADIRGKRQLPLKHGFYVGFFYTAALIKQLPYLPYYRLLFPWSAIQTDIPKFQKLCTLFYILFPVAKHVSCPPVLTFYLNYRGVISSFSTKTKWHLAPSDNAKSEINIKSRTLLGPAYTLRLSHILSRYCLKYWFKYWETKALISSFPSCLTASRNSSSSISRSLNTPRISLFSTS